MSRIITRNANDIRSAARKGFCTWLTKQGAGIMACLRETRAQTGQIDAAVLHSEVFLCPYTDAQKRGAGWVAMDCNGKSDVTCGLEDALIGAVGRLRSLAVASLSLPCQSSAEERQARRQLSRKRALCDDGNIAHTNPDIRNWRHNHKNAGFPPDERAWLNRSFTAVGQIDACRDLPQEYTGCRRRRARANTGGWRINDPSTRSGLCGKMPYTTIYRDDRRSGHAPLRHV